MITGANAVRLAKEFSNARSTSRAFVTAIVQLRVDARLENQCATNESCKRGDFGSCTSWLMTNYWTGS
jgi:hypothetical protein